MKTNKNRCGRRNSTFSFFFPLLYCINYELGAHTPSPAELRKAHEQDLKHNGNLKKVVLVTEATQTEGDTEKV